LKERGKATDIDNSAAAFLYPLSTLTTVTTGESFAASDMSSHPSELTNVAQELLRTKFDVGHLSTHDLLLRDYKQYDLPSTSRSYRAGLSTVPLSLKNWLEKEGGWAPFLGALDAYMQERGLDVEGILTSYKSENKGKGKRELALFVREGGALASGADAQRVLDTLAQGLQADPVLSLEAWSKKDWAIKAETLNDSAEGRYGVVWQQGNAKATRKQVAPILRDLISKLR